VDERRVRVTGTIEVLDSIGPPAEGGVVEEADVHPVGGERAGREGDGGDEREQAETDETILQGRGPLRVGTGPPYRPHMTTL
jgi:hypothetical protein